MDKSEIFLGIPIVADVVLEQNVNLEHSVRRNEGNPELCAVLEREDVALTDQAFARTDQEFGSENAVT
jgi:hypothetical protein